MNHIVSRYYEIGAPCVRDLKNPHQKEAPVGAPFFVIGPGSPLKWRKAAEEVAYYFRREGHFDSPPYEANEIQYGLEYATARVLVFHHDDCDPDFNDLFFFIGAVGVRWVKWDKAPASWSVEWAWIHPYKRRSGVLKKAWPFIVEMFPNIWVSHPLSDAMKGFLQKIGYTNPLNGCPLPPDSPTS